MHSESLNVSLRIYMHMFVGSLSNVYKYNFMTIAFDFGSLVNQPRFSRLQRSIPIISFVLPYRNTFDLILSQFELVVQVLYVDRSS